MNKEDLQDKLANVIPTTDDLNKMIVKLIREKQSLIKYLEDKIEEHRSLMNETYIEQGQIIELVRLQTYQEILDKIRGENNG